MIVTVSESFVKEAFAQFPPDTHPARSVHAYAEAWISQNCQGKWGFVSVFDIEFERAEDAILFRLRFE